MTEPVSGLPYTLDDFQRDIAWKLDEESVRTHADIVRTQILPDHPNLVPEGILFALRAGRVKMALCLALTFPETLSQEKHFVLAELAWDLGQLEMLNACMRACVYPSTFRTSAIVYNSRIMDPVENETDEAAITRIENGFVAVTQELMRLYSPFCYLLPSSTCFARALAANRTHPYMRPLFDKLEMAGLSASVLDFFVSVPLHAYTVLVAYQAALDPGFWLSIVNAHLRMLRPQLDEPRTRAMMMGVVLPFFRGLSDQQAITLRAATDAHATAFLDVHRRRAAAFSQFLDAWAAAACGAELEGLEAARVFVTRDYLATESVNLHAVLFYATHMMATRSTISHGLLACFWRIALGDYINDFRQKLLAAVAVDQQTELVPVKWMLELLTRAEHLPPLGGEPWSVDECVRRLLSPVFLTEAPMTAAKEAEDGATFVLSRLSNRPTPADALQMMARLKIARARRNLWDRQLVAIWDGEFPTDSTRRGACLQPMLSFALDHYGARKPRRLLMLLAHALRAAGGGGAESSFSTVVDQLEMLFRTQEFHRESHAEMLALLARFPVFELMGVCATTNDARTLARIASDLIYHHGAAPAGGSGRAFGDRAAYTLLRVSAASKRAALLAELFGDDLRTPLVPTRTDCHTRTGKRSDGPGRPEKWQQWYEPFVQPVARSSPNAVAFWGQLFAPGTPRSVWLRRALARADPPLEDSDRLRLMRWAMSVAPRAANLLCVARGSAGPASSLLPEMMRFLRRRLTEDHCLDPQVLETVLTLGLEVEGAVAAAPEAVYLACLALTCHACGTARHELGARTAVRRLTQWAATNVPLSGGGVALADEPQLSDRLACLLLADTFKGIIPTALRAFPVPAVLLGARRGGSDRDWPWAALWEARLKVHEVLLLRGPVYEAALSDHFDMSWTRLVLDLCETGHFFEQVMDAGRLDELCELFARVAETPRQRRMCVLILARAVRLLFELAFAETRPDEIDLVTFRRVARVTGLAMGDRLFLQDPCGVRISAVRAALQLPSDDEEEEEEPVRVQIAREFDSYFHCGFVTQPLFTPASRRELLDGLEATNEEDEDEDIGMLCSLLREEASV